MNDTRLRGKAVFNVVSTGTASSSRFQTLALDEDQDLQEAKGEYTCSFWPGSAVAA